MDGNKDEAVKCLRIGKEALGAGDKARALRFLSKARRLDPTLPVDELLSSINGEESNGSECGSVETERPGLRARGSASSKDKAAAASSSGDSVRAACTEEQVTIVAQIKKQKDYYQILGLERSCSVEDVRKAYRKLSLRVHPDKNKAPGAEEAFKAVSKAFQCLSNEESRKRYDLVGSEEPVQRRAAARHDAYGFNGFYEAEFDADEIFRNFFFGGMSPATTQFGAYRFRTGGMGAPRAHHVNATSNSGLRTLIQVLPVILLLLLNFLPSSEPPFTLSPSYSHGLRLETQRGVPFYVKPRKFEEQYPYGSAERLAIEERVEREYVSIVSQNCRMELQRQQWGWVTHTPHCDMLRKYEAAAA